jgi:hypothetical protein
VSTPLSVPELRTRDLVDSVCRRGAGALQLWGDLGSDEFEVIQVVQVECLQVEPGDAVLGELTYLVDHLGRGYRPDRRR